VARKKVGSHRNGYCQDIGTQDGEETGELFHGGLDRYELINDILVIIKILPLG
jgi:hypothetical protein